MNKTKIEWADATWNPVTGCFHDCPYCYAARIARRFGLPYAPRLGDPGMEGAYKYDTDEAGMDTMLELEKPYVRGGRKQPFPMGFYPTLHRYRLDEPQKWKKPRTIFVCSMADLFGEWVPDEWINAVFDACRAAPQHNYLFLTKNYMRACHFRYEKNWWIGRTITHDEGMHGQDDPNLYLCYGRPKTAENKAPWAEHQNKFISLEPLQSAIPDLPYYAHDYGYKWVIVGAETGNRFGKIVPEKPWINYIVASCDARGVPVFMKDSLIPIVGEENMRREFPW